MINDLGPDQRALAGQKRASAQRDPEAIAAPTQLRPDDARWAAVIPVGPGGRRGSPCQEDRYRSHAHGPPMASPESLPHSTYPQWRSTSFSIEARMAPRIPNRTISLFLRKMIGAFRRVDARTGGARGVPRDG